MQNFQGIVFIRIRTYKEISKTALVYLQFLFLQKQPPEMFYKKSVLRNFAKFTGKHVCQSIFFNKVSGLRPLETILLRKRLCHRCFVVNFAKFLRTPVLQKTFWWLLLFLVVILFSQFRNFPRFLQHYFTSTEHQRKRIR